MRTVPTILVALTFLVAVHAQTTTHQVTLTGAQQLPPVSTSATAQLTISFNTDSNNVTYNLVANNIPNPVAAHIHVNAGPSQNGSVGVPLWEANFKAPSGAPPANGLIASTAVAAAAFLGPLEVLPDYNNVPVSQLLSQYIETGRAYAQVHTLSNPKGYIRGNFNSSTEDNSAGPVEPSSAPIQILSPPSGSSPSRSNAAAEATSNSG